MGDGTVRQGTLGRILKRTRELMISIIQMILSLFLVVLVLEFVLRTGIWNNPVIPLPSEVWLRFLEIGIRQRILFDHVQLSLTRMVIGYLLAVVFGLLVGALLGQSKILEEMFQPSLSFMMSIPTIAWVPFLLVTLGLGDRTILTAIFLGGFFAIAYNTMEGMRGVKDNLINVGRTMNLSLPKMFFKVYLPGSMVSIITGLRLGISYSWRALVGAEMLAAMIELGIGKMIIEARIWNDLTTMVLGLVMIGILGMLMDKVLIGMLEERTVKKWGMLREGR